MQYSIQQISEIIGGEFVLAEPTEAMIEHILLDSRQVAFPLCSLFVALPGRQRDGHEFIEDLQKEGVRNFLISKELPAGLALPTANYLKVPDTTAALQALAAYHRGQFDIPVIGITGSNGKTVVKEWLFQLLRKDHHIVRSPKSYNSQIGVPLSILQMEPKHELAIFEAGISEVGEMEKLAGIIRPTIGVFTNLGEAHSEGFVSMEEKGREKWKLFERVKAVVSNAGFTGYFSGSGKPQFFTWSKNESTSQVKVLSIEKSIGGTRLFFGFNGEKVKCDLRATDAASIENAITCFTVLTYLGYSALVIAERLKKLEPVAMRLELREALNGCTLVNDSYNSDLTSLRIALEFLEQQSQNPKRTIILSDILQSGKSPSELYAQVADLLKEKKVNRFVGIGKEVEVLEKLLPSKIEKTFFENTSDFFSAYPGLLFQNETILLKGARDFGFEKIAERLASKVHQTVLEVNLSALLHNLRVYQSHLRPGTEMMVMVKASAYGSGSVQVAKLLEFQQVDYLSVAYADEGVELREAGIQLPIMVLNPEEATFDSLLRYRLEPEIYSLGLLNRFISFLEENGGGRTVNVHLKLDTGMHRLGFEKKELAELLQSPIASESGNQPVTVKSIFTHLAASESSTHDEFSNRQIEQFERMYERIASALGYRPMRHVLNSGGIVRFPEKQMEMVRLGIGLYGIDSSGLVQEKLQTVNTLRATVSQVKKVAQGETVGYGRKGIADSEMTIATISIGYADGLLRRSGNGRFRVLIRGERASIFGAVCMDMTMVDVSHVPDVSVGDEVIVFGESQEGIQLPVQELADCLGTIPYEIFTSISERVKRVYVQE